MALRLVHSRSDLPPFWDGVPVKWSEWSTGSTTIAFHAPAENLACDKCGAIDEPAINFGERPPEEPTITSWRTKRTRSGKAAFKVSHEVPSWPVRDLVAARCKHCGHDVVTDLRTDERWDLEESDYGPGGSLPTDTLF